MKKQIKQILENLPKEILNLPRFVHTRKTKPKAPYEGWQLPENQKFYNELEKPVGFVAATEDDNSFVFYDFDHVLDDNGNFVNENAEKWFNYLHSYEYFCERTISGKGLHMFGIPTKGKFPKGRFELDLGDGAKIEIFYGTNKNCCVTGDCFHCEPCAPVAHGQAADEMFQAVLNEVAKQSKNAVETKQEAPAELIYQSAENHSNNLGIEYDLFRAEIMLEAINPADLSDSDWLAVMTACKNIGVSYPVVDAFNLRDSKRYDEKENLERWNSTTDPSFDIETLHGIAKKFGYSEKDARREWYQLHPEFKNQIIHRPEPMTDDDKEKFSWTQDKIKSCPVNIRLPEDFIFSKSGIYKIVETKKETKYIPVTKTPIIPSKIFYDPIKQTDAYEISILSRGRWRHVEVDAETLGDAKALKFFCNYGALIIDNGHLKNFFASIIAINADMKETKAYSKTGWTDDDCTEFIYPTPDADFICRRVGYDFDKIFKPKGDAELWKQTFIEIDKQGGAVAHVAIGAALSSVVVKPLGLPNPQVHILGKSGIGKSALLKFAASIYGDPSEGALTRTFAATMKNQMETAVAFSDLPIVIDELETLNKRDEENLPTTIYNFSLGVSNQAQHRNGTAREVKNFSAARITTGERPILKHNDKRGAYKRILNLRASELFEDAFATKIHNSCKRNHALFGATWIDFCTKNIPFLREKFDNVVESVLKTQTKKIDPTQLKTLVNSLVCYMQFKRRIGLIDLTNEDDIAKANAEFLNDINAIIATLPTADEIDDTTRAIDFLKSFVAGNDRAFVHEVDKPDFNNEFTQQTPECIGKIFKDGEVAFLPHAFTEILEKRGGFASADKLREDFYDKGYLRHSSGNATYPTYFRDKKVRMIRFLPNIITTEELTKLENNASGN